MARSAHVDTFAADNLPPRDQWPEFINLDRLAYPERMNCAVELVDRNVAEGRGDKLAVVGATSRWTYSELAEKINRIANVLVNTCGLKPGNRVLLRFPNTPTMVAAYFAVLKAGGVVVATMPLLRAKELAVIVDKAELSLAICDSRLKEEMELTKAKTDRLSTILYSGGDEAGSLEALMDEAAPDFAACDTASDDVCLLGFTSGTTGVPKATMHFHRDMLAICDCYSREVLRPQESDVFMGSPPLAFTFGLGGLVLFPFRVGATAVLLERARPGRPAEGNPGVQADGTLHRADRLSGDPGQEGRDRPFLPAQMRVGG